MSDKHDVELIIVGNELLRGDRRDSHIGYLGRRLLDIGVRVDRAHVVGDQRSAIASAVGEAKARSKVAVVTGGLGPTHDDVTREAVADALGVRLEFDEEQWRAIKGMFAKYGWRVSESNRRQAYFPEGAVPIPNKRGTAPGFVVTAGGCRIWVLPGPPREFQAMVEDVVLRGVVDIIRRDPLFTETFRTAGIGESALTPIIERLLTQHPVFTVASLPHVAGVDLLIRSEPGAGAREELVEKAGAFEADLRRALGHKIYARGDARLEEVIGETLAQRGATLAIAESLTGGLLGKRMTDVPGSSRYVLADIVAYSNESKSMFLGVREESLKTCGAVSEAVCREMADGIRVKTGATFGLSTTGIAGPSGGTDEKPVGLCYFGLTWDGGSDIRKRVFPGTRDDVRKRVVWASLFMLHERLS